MIEWKRIPSFPDYEVSSNGLVRMGERLLAIGLSGIGYPTCSLKKDGRWFKRTVHTLALESFTGPRPHGNDACHIDGSKDNNNINNLRWGTRKENVADMYAHGNGPIGKRNGLSKLTNNEVLTIRKKRNAGTPVSVLAKEYRVHKSNISQIALRQTWSWLGDPETTDKETK